MANDLKNLIKTFEGLKEHIIERHEEEVKEIVKYEAFDTGEFWNSIDSTEDGVYSDDDPGKTYTIEYGGINRSAVAPFARAAAKTPQFVDEYFEESIT